MLGAAHLRFVVQTSLFPAHALDFPIVLDAACVRFLYPAHALDHGREPWDVGAGTGVLEGMLDFVRSVNSFQLSWTLRVCAFFTN